MPEQNPPASLLAHLNLNATMKDSVGVPVSQQLEVRSKAERLTGCSIVKDCLHCDL